MSLKNSLWSKYRFTSLKNVSIANAQCGLVQTMIRTDHVWKKNTGGARGEMVIVVGNGHGDTSSNPGWG